MTRGSRGLVALAVAVMLVVGATGCAKLMEWLGLEPPTPPAALPKPGGPRMGRLDLPPKAPAAPDAKAGQDKLPPGTLIPLPPGPTLPKVGIVKPTPKGPQAILPKPGTAAIASRAVKPKTATIADSLIARPKAPAKAPAAKPRDYSKFTADPIPPERLYGAKVEAWTNGGNVSIFDATISNGNQLIMRYLTTDLKGGEAYRDSDGKVRKRRKTLAQRDLQSVNAGYTYDLDRPGLSAKPTDADFRWDATRGLIPQNGARFRFLLDFRAITRPQAIAAKTVANFLIRNYPPSVDHTDYLYFFETDQGRYTKATIHYIGNYRYRITRLCTWKKDSYGAKVSIMTPFVIKKGDTLDLDSGKLNTRLRTNKPDLKVIKFFGSFLSYRSGLNTVNGAKGCEDKGWSKLEEESRSSRGF